MRTRTALFALLTVFIAACGSADPKEAGFEALQRAEYADAVYHLEVAMEAAEPGTEEYLEVAVARCEALAYTDPATCKAEFMALVASAAEQISTQDFSMVVTRLMETSEYVAAIDILEAGVNKFPDDPKMGKLKDKVVEKSQKAADPAALEALKGLGYI
jgi:hypothetical protein